MASQTNQNGFKYKIKSGESLDSLGRRFCGKSWEWIYNDSNNANLRSQYTNPTIIPVGVEIWIPTIANEQTVIHKSGNIIQTQDTGASATGLDEAVFYSPSTQSYLLLKKEDFADYIKDCDEFDNLRASLINAQTKPIASGLTGDALKTAIESKNNEVQKEKDHFVSAIKASDNGPDFEELVCLNKVKRLKPQYVKGWRAVRKSTRAKAHWRSLTKDELEKQLNSLYPTEEKKKKFKDAFGANIKTTLWESETISGFVPLPKEWKFLPPGQQVQAKTGENPYFEASAEAAFLRYQCGAAAQGEYDLKEGKIEFGLTGTAKFALAEGKAEVVLYPITQKGWSLLNLVPADAKKYIKPNHDVKFRFAVTLGVTGFAGINAALSLPVVSVEMNEEKKKAEVCVKGEAFAGVSGGVEGNLAMDFNFNAEVKWATLYKAGFEASFRAGAGIAFDLGFRWVEGNKVQFIIKAGAVVGIGAKVDLTCEMDPIGGFKVLFHVLDCVDFHKAVDVDPHTFSIFSVAKFLLLVNPVVAESIIAAEGAKLLADYVSTQWTWWDVNSTVQKAEDRETLKRLLGDLQHQMNLKQSPPESLGMALRLIMQTRENSDFPVILQILESAASEAPKDETGQESYHKLRWTIRNIMGREEASQDKEGTLQKGSERLRSFFSSSGHDNQEDLKSILRKVN